MFIPKIGRLLITTGNNAQWIAQATEVAIPIKSQLTFIAINVMLYGKNSKFATMMQDFYHQNKASAVIL